MTRQQATALNHTATNTKRRKPMKPPRIVLKELRERSGISGSEIARLLGFKGPSGYFRYEDRQPDDKMVSHRLINALLPILVGRGTPPITADELLAISDATDLGGVKPSALGASLLSRPLEAAPTDVVPQRLPIRYKLEAGLFRDLSSTAKSTPTHGASNLVPTPEASAEEQLCVVVADDHAAPTFQRGTILHCVAPDQFAPAALVGRRVVVAAPREGAPDLVELLLATVTRINTRPHLIRMDGAPVEGKILAVALYAYVRL